MDLENTHTWKIKECNACRRNSWVHTTWIRQDASRQEVRIGLAPFVENVLQFGNADRRF